MSVPRPDDLAALRDAAGPEAVDATAAFEIDGTKLGVAVTPPDEDALARTVAVLAARGIGCAIRGGGTRQAFGNPLRDAGVLLSTTAIQGILELDAEEGVAHVRAGTPLRALRDAVHEAGWELPFDPPGTRATLGGTLATAAVGPRHPGFGRPRDRVIGMEVVLGDGTRTRCGGRVVKNVTGYDLMKLHIGGCGAFGVVTAAWLRLAPRPESEHVLCAVLTPDALPRALDAARLPTLRACTLVDASFAAAVEPTRAPARGWLMVAECAGDEAAIAVDVSALRDRFGAFDASPNALGRVRALQGETFGPVGLRFRIAVLPSHLAAVVADLHAAGAALLVHPATGLLHARFSLDVDVDGAGVDRAWMALRSAARAAGGHVVLEAGPTWAKLRDVFGDADDEWRVARALKARFDPARVLNPGRYVGGI
ncbi:MAG: FAD-binding oxidoreductase [Myxococcota bacterium]|jgi:glycolate oxidase FAD binding subunit|nr:FAD-binding oxidoreductase [Myxococcota bacterium]